METWGYDSSSFTGIFNCKFSDTQSKGIRFSPEHPLEKRILRKIDEYEQILQDDRVPGSSYCLTKEQRHGFEDKLWLLNHLLNP